MKNLRAVCAVLLAIPYVVFGSNYFLHFFELPPGDGSAGAQLLDAMRAGGLMGAVAAGHVLAGVLLLVPRTRFLGALAHLPLTLGIFAFHATMSHAGIPMAAVLLALNVGALADRARLLSLIAPATPAQKPSAAAVPTTLALSR